jgi:hypothetical protein
MTNPEPHRDTQPTLTGDHNRCLLHRGGDVPTAVQGTEGHPGRPGRSP